MQSNEYYQKLLELTTTNQALWQASIIHTDGSSPARLGMKMLIPLSGAFYGNLGGGEMEHKIIEYVRQNQPAEPQLITYDLGSGLLGEKTSTSMICGGSATVFIDVLHIPNNLYIIGAGHCGKALGQLAKLSGFWVHLIDNRENILAEVPAACFHQKKYSDFSQISRELTFGPHTWIVIMTHGHVHDQQVLQQCLRQEYRYLGMMGSQHKVAEIFAVLRKQGFDEADIQKIHAPIGIKIGSQQPYEIAISIMAEIIRELRTK